MSAAGLRALSAGRFAQRAARSGPGVVRAVFRRSFYVQHPAGFVCVADRSLGNGPLNVLVDDPVIPALDSRMVLDLGHAQPWRAPSFRCGPSELSALEKEARPPGEGLGGLIVGRRDALATHAAPALAAIDVWRANGAMDDAAESLIGLGPGLTPSGDDYFGGMLIALRTVGREAQADALWQWLEPRLESRTSALSAAHLAAAAEGEGHEALHACLAKACGGEGEWPALLAALDAVGHSSGWDALAGAHAVLRAA